MIIVIDGMIGSGKSTLIKKLSKDYQCFEEPVHKWTFLKHFYEDKKKFAFPFQVQVLFSFFDIYEKIKNSKDVIIIERSPSVSKNIFFDLLVEENLITENERLVYNELYQKFNFKESYRILLDCDIETSTKRIKNRDRLEETSITKDYIEKLSSKYKSTNIENTLFLDGSLSADHVYKNAKIMIERLSML